MNEITMCMCKKEQQQWLGLLQSAVIIRSKFNLMSNWFDLRGFMLNIVILLVVVTKNWPMYVDDYCGS